MTRDPRLYGLVAEFDGPDALIDAAHKVHAAGYKRFDAYAPYPIHDLPHAMGLDRTAVPLLVLIGGVDWNSVNRDITRRLDLPVRQQVRPSEKDPGFFSTADGTTFAPVLDQATGGLIEDVAHFFRGKNPYNARRTVTLCNGMYSRGTYGAVRALTHASFRDRNEDFLQRRFPADQAFSILMRVRINPNGDAVTPDWTQAEERLHEWPSDGEA